jgi:hypothetical protein
MMMRVQFNGTGKMAANSFVNAHRLGYRMASHHKSIIVFELDRWLPWHNICKNAILTARVWHRVGDVNVQETW